MIIRSCNGRVEPPPFMHAHKLKIKLNNKKKKSTGDQSTPCLLSWGGEKKELRGESPSSIKIMSSLVHFDPSQTHSTIQTEGRHHEDSFGVTVAPLTSSSEAIFFNNRMGGKHWEWWGVVGIEAETETSQCQSVFLSALMSFLSIFLKLRDECEALGHYCLDI